MTDVCGFMVLRKPSENFDGEGQGAFLPYAPKLGDIYYAGVDRMPWFELDEHYFAGVLPENFVQLRKELRHINQNLTDFKLIYDIEKAIAILEYSNQINPICELIAIESSDIIKVKGVINCEAIINWIGIDIYCHGYGSLIREGLFNKPKLFSFFSNEVNEHGLFNMNSELIDEYIDTYIKCSKINNLEKINGAIKHLDKIAVGRVMGVMGKS
ncbi:MAG: hypothetical protein GY795_16310 [Desulfobacterales bacterium]|nr:hypothetical protein [Desulfobacterales bacterium]